jgi:aspartate dehydrogenase
MRIALIGYGAIGRQVHKLLLDQSKVIVCGALVRRPEQYRASASDAPQLFDSSLEALLAGKPDLVVECAGHAAVDAYGVQVLHAGVDLLVGSVGSFARPEREQALLAAARAMGRCIFIPAGALGGLDWMQAAQRAGLDSVQLKSSKPAKAWKGTPAQERLDLDALTEPALVFEGNAREAALRFPQNANVAATLALAGIGFEQTQVQLWADPSLQVNQHEVTAQSRMGRMQLQLQGYSDPANPKTSISTAYSIVRAIVNRKETLVL